MLRITLYKNSILNETYANVFSLGKKSNKTILEHYLDTLAKKQYEIDYVYQENSGTLVFDYDIDTMSNIYDFNYMKVETIEDENVKILRYCFIQDIKLKNALVYLSYEEDMWHSYIDKIAGINESYVDSSRLVDYENGFNLKVRSLPYKYEGNKKVIFSSVIGNNNDTNAKFIAVVELQRYNEGQQGEITDRVIEYYISDFEPNNVPISGNELTSLIFWINKIEGLKSTKKFHYDNDYSYEIGDIFIIPKEFGLQNHISIPDEPDGYIEYSSGMKINFFSLMDYSQSKGLTLLKEIEIQNNFKLLSLGTLSKQFKITPNGNSFKISLYYSNIPDKFALFLNLNNTLIDITKDFSHDLAISALNSEKLSQLRIARNLSETTIKEDIRIVNAETVEKEFKNAENGVKGGLKLAAGIALTATGFGAALGIPKIIQGSAELGSATSKAATDAVIANAKKNKLKAELSAVDAPVYTSNNGCFGNDENFLNSRYGIVALYINSQNDDFVKKAINNLGYISYEFLNDISKLRINDANYFISKSINYNFISFKSVSCYGSFVRNTAKVLNGILESGVKIWYTETMAEDNYEVG